MDNSKTTEIKKGRNSIVFLIIIGLCLLGLLCFISIIFLYGGFFFSYLTGNKQYLTTSSSSSSIKSSLNIIEDSDEYRLKKFTSDLEVMCDLINSNNIQKAYDRSDISFKEQFTYSQFLSKLAMPIKNCITFVPNYPLKIRSNISNSNLIQYYVDGKLKFDSSDVSIHLSYTYRNGNYYFTGLTDASF